MKQIRKFFPFYFILFTFILFASCSTDPEPPNIEPVPSYQHEIPWPSLADSPWPMHKSDPQNTSRSKYIGPSSGIIKKLIEIPYLISTPVINENRNIMFVSEQPCTLGIIDEQDSLTLIPIDESEVFTSSLVDDENNIYVLGYFYLSKFNAEGELLWTYRDFRETTSLGLTIDINGNIFYLVHEKILKVISSNGELVWEFRDSRLLDSPHHLPAFSPDGKTLYLQGETISLLALDLQSRQVKWAFGEDELWSNPSVDSYGNIYIMPRAKGTQFSNYLYCLSPNGEVSWKYKINGNSSHEVAINNFGDIILGLQDTLYSFAFDGSVNWKLRTNQKIVSEPIVDNEGNIYFSGNLNISAVSKEGNYIFTTPELKCLIEQCLIDERGRLITVPLNDKYIYIIE